MLQKRCIEKHLLCIFGASKSLHHLERDLKGCFLSSVLCHLAGSCTGRSAFNDLNINMTVIYVLNYFFFLKYCCKNKTAIPNVIALCTIRTDKIKKTANTK